MPENCLRGRKDCEPLSQITSDTGDSFICCGHNDGASRVHLQDRFRVCWKNDVIDELSDWDDTDIKHTMSVLSHALAVDQSMVNESE